MSNGGASGGATSFAEGSTVWPIYPSNSIKSNNNIYKLTSKSQYSDFIRSLFININIELLIIIIKTKNAPMALQDDTIGLYV